MSTIPMLAYIIPTSFLHNSYFSEVDCRSPLQHAYWKFAVSFLQFIHHSQRNMCPVLVRPHRNHFIARQLEHSGFIKDIIKNYLQIRQIWRKRIRHKLTPVLKNQAFYSCFSLLIFSEELVSHPLIYFDQNFSWCISFLLCLRGATSFLFFDHGVQMWVLQYCLLFLSRLEGSSPLV